MTEANFIIITPARDEANYLAKTIESVLSQTILPREWVIVDDGSTDETAQIAEDASRIYPWIRVIRRYNRGHRFMGVGIVEAFNEGLSNISSNNYEFLFNIDGDIVLRPDYFKRILAKFAENPGLGIAGGVIYDYLGGRKIRMRELPEMTTGAVKCWRRKCFQEIGGLARGLGYDGIDCYKAMMLGWDTKTFEDEELQILHLRPVRSSIHNRCHGWARRGRALYFSGAHPLWLLASAFYHVLDSPYLIGSLCMIIGYLDALLKGSDKYDDPEFHLFLRKWQVKKLGNILRIICRAEPLS